MITFIIIHTYTLAFCFQLWFSFSFSWKLPTRVLCMSYVWPSYYDIIYYVYPSTFRNYNLWPLFVERGTIVSQNDCVSPGAAEGVKRWKVILIISDADSDLQKLTQRRFFVLWWHFRCFCRFRFCCTNVEHFGLACEAVHSATHSLTVVSAHARYIKYTSSVWRGKVCRMRD